MKGSSQRRTEIIMKGLKGKEALRKGKGKGKGKGREHNEGKGSPKKGKGKATGKGKRKGKEIGKGTTPDCHSGKF